MANERKIGAGEIDRLFDFLDGLQASGYTIDPRQYMALSDLLLALVARGERLEDVSLKTLIAPVICSTPTEQQDFYQRFDRWYPTLLPARQVNLSSEGIPPTPLSKRRWSFLKINRTVVIWGLTIGSILALFVWLISNSGTTTGTQGNNNLLAYGLIIVFIGLIVWFGWRLWILYQENQYIAREVTDQEPIHTKIPIKAYVQEILPVIQFKPIVSALRRRTQVPSSEVDVDRTIETALNRNNWIEIVYRQRHVMPEYIVLIDRKSRLDQQARFVQEVLAKFALDGVWLHPYEFSGDPRICFPLDKKDSPLQLKDLQSRHQDARLLVFSGTSELINPLTGQLHDWLEPLSHWRERAILAADMVQKVLLEELQSRDFVVLPLTLDGIASLVRAFETDNTPFLTNGLPNLPAQLIERPLRWTGRDVPPDAEVSALVHDVKNYLGENGFYWLCATAVYPELRWELTLFLGNALKDDTEQPLLNPDGLLRLTRLSWFRLGYMPDWIRKSLILSFTPKQETSVRDVISELLSTAFKGNDFDLTFSRGTQGSWRRHTRRFLDALFRNSLTDSQLRDDIFVKFIISSDLKKLAVQLPKSLFSRELLNTFLIPFSDPNTFRLRYEVGESIIYRKHWIVLILDKWIPFTGSTAILLLFMVRLVQLAYSPGEAFLSFQGGLSVDVWALASLIAIFPFAGWMAYEILHWTYEKLEITPEQILLIDRKPFGTETRNTVRLENVLSTEYKRVEVLERLFNFGTVYFTIGSSKLGFEDVMDPAAVQAEIDRRRQQIIDRINSISTAEINLEATRLLRVFLCHSSDDKPIVQDLYRRLDTEDWIDVWLDSERIVPGQEWDLEINKAVEKADMVLVCLTKNAVENDGSVRPELRMVLDAVDYKREATLFMIPVRLEESETPERLREGQHVDLFKKGGYRRLISVLRARASTIGVTLPKAGTDYPELDFTKTKDTDRTFRLQRERKRLLLADPSRAYRRSVMGFLELEGYVVEEASNLGDAIGKLESTQFDLVLAEIRLRDESDSNDMSGMEVAKLASAFEVPCIIVTAFPTVELAHLALRSRAGEPFASDIITKTAGPEAILDAIRLVLSKNDSESTTDVITRGLHMDLRRKLVWSNGKLLQLAKNQYTLLEELYKKEGGVCTYEELLKAVYDEESSNVVARNDRRLRNLVERLKEKIEDKNSDQEIIEAVIGRGYRLRIPSGLTDLENVVKENQSPEPLELKARETVEEAYSRLGLPNLGAALQQDSVEGEIAVWGPTQSGKDWLFRGFARELDYFNAKHDDFLFELSEITDNGTRQIIAAPPHNIHPTSTEKDYVYSFRRRVSPEYQDEAHRISSHLHKIIHHNNAGRNLLGALTNRSKYESAFIPIVRSKYLMVVLDASINLSSQSEDKRLLDDEDFRPDIAKEEYFRFLSLLMQLLADSGIKDRQMAICITKLDTTGFASNDPWVLLETLFGQKLYRLINRYRKRFNIEAFATSAVGYYLDSTGRNHANFSGGKIIDVDSWNPVNCAAPFFWLFENQEREQLRKSSNFLIRDNNLKKYIPYPTRRNL